MKLKKLNYFPTIMGHNYISLLVLSIIAACICGGRTECSKKGQISFLTNIHDDLVCEKISSKGVMMFEAAKYLIDAHNNKSNAYKLELSVLDTCGSIAGAVKATMKALVWADTNCLRPPNFLGIIGPQSLMNIEAVQKITSTLQIPHIVRQTKIASYLHHLSRESDSFIIQGILEVIEALRWKSFTLMTSTFSSNEDDVQHIAKKVTMGAIARGLCVLIYDEDFDDVTRHIIHIGKPSERLMKRRNATILIASEGNLEMYLSKFSTSSNILLLEDSRNEFNGLENKVEASRWWSNNDGIGKYDTEELRDIRWLEDAIGIYAKSFEALCGKQQQCFGNVSPSDWNNIVSNTISTHNAQLQITSRTLELSMMKNNRFVKLGRIIVRKSHAKIRWQTLTNSNNNERSVSKFAEAKKDQDDLDFIDEGMPQLFRNLLSNEMEVLSGCATSVKDSKSSSDDDDDVAKISVEDDINNEEWWTMVLTVGGIGVSMFTIGILAVYIVIANIRGPKTPKMKNKRQVSRDPSLRRVPSDQDLQVVDVRPQRPQRPYRAPRMSENHQRDSSRSIRSAISDRSV